MIEVENKVSSELIAHLKTVIYRHCIDDFIAFSSDEIKSKIKDSIDEQMNTIRYSLLSEHANVVVLREKYKILESLKKEL